jgi:peptidoglycan/xylan/chitin deacetylase (PgdA/CDA1 family)
MKVAVVIPARNAAATLSRTLESILEQSSPDWEAIIVDDGSTDRTATIAEEFAAKDGRFRVVRQQASGVSAARNAGITAARGEWLLFLDSDDWIAPQHLEHMTGVVKDRPELDAVVCGWIRVLPDGSLLGNGNFPPEGDLFEVFGCRCAVAIHACLVRRSLVEKVGRFDETLATCEDWDLWQRMARTGTKFALLREVLAYYRMRPASLTTDGSRFLADGLRVIERGHRPDSRVTDALPAHIDGLPAEHLDGAKMRFACWPAAVALGQGQDARPLLDMLGEARDPVLDPSFVAVSIFEAAPLPTCRCLSEWNALWPLVAHRLDALLGALEERSKVPRLARRTRRALETMIVELPRAPRPLKAGLTHAETIEVTAPLRDVVATGAERLVCDLVMEGKPLGRIRLPVCDGFVPASVLADAIAAEHAWAILGAFFERTIYRNLRAEESEAGVSIFRGDLCLAEGLSVEVTAHDHIGWTVFLQELWGSPDSSESALYDPYPVEPRAAETRFDIEISEEILDRGLEANAAEVAVTIGGARIGLIHVAVQNGWLSAAAIRAAINVSAGFELCRVAVREALLGKPFEPSASLRARLVEAASGERSSHAGVTFGPRPVQPMGSSSSRLAVFPAAAVAELSHAAAISRQPVQPIYQVNGSRRLVLHAPGVVAPFRTEFFRAPVLELPPESQGDDGHHFEEDVEAVGEVVEEERPDEMPDDVSCEAPCDGGEVPCVESVKPVTTARLPILMYHRVAPQGAAATARWRLTPEAFEEQLRYLRDAGFYSVTLDQWREAAQAKKPLPGRAVLLTFDDGYRDFAEQAWPLLKRYAFSAIMFLVAGKIGGTNDWDRAFGEEVELMDWDEILALQKEGVEFGCHTVTHAPLTGLSPAELVRELARSRAILEEKLKRPVDAIAYPYGDQDRAVQHLTGACGYTFGLSCRPGTSRFQDRLLELPRIEVMGGMPLQEFVAKLGE